MIRVFASPLAFQQSLDAQLRQEAARRGRNMERERQLLVYDRFMVRVTRVFGQDAAVLKGGLALELRLDRARSTRDVDLRVLGGADEALPRLRDAGLTELGDYLTYEVRADPRQPKIQAPGMIYEGRRYMAEAKLAGRRYGNPFGVDVAFAEPLVESPDTFSSSGLLRFVGIEPEPIRVYPPSTHIAEKLHAYTLPRVGAGNSRVKDLPDIVLLSTLPGLGAETLGRAIEATFRHRDTHGVPGSFPGPPGDWGSEYARIVKTDRLSWPTIDDALAAAREFLNPILRGEARGVWRPESRDWG